MTNTLPTHPCDTIKDAPTFDEALTLYIAACEYEADRSREAGKFRLRDSFYEEAASAAGARYLVGKVEKDLAIELLYAHESTTLFAEALESGDFAKLAF